MNSFSFRTPMRGSIYFGIVIITVMVGGALVINIKYFASSHEVRGLWLALSICAGGPGVCHGIAAIVAGMRGYLVTISQNAIEVSTKRHSCRLSWSDVEVIGLERRKFPFSRSCDAWIVVHFKPGSEILGDPYHLPSHDKRWDVWLIVPVMNAYGKRSSAMTRLAEMAGARWRSRYLDSGPSTGRIGKDGE